MDQNSEILRNHKLKITETRLLVLDAFSKKSYAMSHSDLEMVLESKLDRVTLYRTLNSFEEKGLIHTVHKGDKVLRYALCKGGCAKNHIDSHVHFSCTECDHIYCMNQTEIPPVQIPGNFKADNFYFLIEGVCETCA